ncbi:MAG: hypothetical protein OEY97_06120 [Nitrospirota bacterium]|nr:hypothetical protein [Nitrospirota bacterium]
MAEAPNVLIVEPASEREGLESLLTGQGFGCVVARGLHTTLVQAAIRTPDLVVVDLSRPGSAGWDAWTQLKQFAHFSPDRFLLIGADGELPATATPEQVCEAVLERLTPSHPPEHPVADTEPEPEPEPEPETSSALTDLLIRLGVTSATTTVTVFGPDGSLGEVLVRNGKPFHAVTADGLSGPEALDAMRNWPAVRVAEGGAPREEAPVSLSPPEPEPAPAAEDKEAIHRLLAELEAVGVIHRVAP